MTAVRARRRARGLVEAPIPTCARPRPVTEAVLGAPARRVLAKVLRRRRASRPAWWTMLTRPGGDESDHASLLESIARSLRGGTSLTGALREAVASGTGNWGTPTAEHNPTTASICCRRERGQAISTSSTTAFRNRSSTSLNL